MVYDFGVNNTGHYYIPALYMVHRVHDPKLEEKNEKKSKIDPDILGVVLLKTFFFRVDIPLVHLHS